MLLGYTRTATEGAGRLAARLHLDGLVTMVRRSYGWLLGAASVAARGLRAPGVLSGLLWGLTTTTGQTLVGKAARAVSTAVSTIASSVGKAVGWTLRLFGTPGARLASWLGSKVTGLKQAATDRVQQLKGLSGLLRPQNLPAKAVGAIARERLLRALVGHFLPRPWSWLVPDRRQHRLAALCGAPRRRHCGRWSRTGHEAHPGPAGAHGADADHTGRHHADGKRRDGRGADRWAR